MKVSVVICTYAEEMYEEFLDAVESIQTQTYDDIEIILVVDGTNSVFVRAREDFGENETVQLHCNDENQGVSYSRTKGAELANGDVVAFIDDDAVAEPDWVEELVTVYQTTDAIAVGGRMKGLWLAGNPWYLPEEFYWLVGVTYPGFADAGEEVRNTFESNISFKRDVFLELGGYDTSFGPDAESYSHSEGAEIGVRLQAEYGRGVVYAPDAIVGHKVFEERIRLWYLFKRAFQQGVSKHRMEKQSSTRGITEESAYLSQLVTGMIPSQCKKVVQSRSLVPIGNIVMTVLLIVVVGFGYLFSSISGYWPISRS